MPVVYVAVGQRLGLPVHLVHTRGHVFFRWDDPKGTVIDWDSPRVQLWIPPERFNVDGAGHGIAYHDDAHYRVWPEKWTQADIDHDRYLKSMTNTEVLADFLIQRAECFYDLGDWNNCLKSIYFARKLAPEDPRYEWLHALRTQQFNDWEKSNLLVIQHQQMQRKKLDSIPGILGHSSNCCCHDCDRVKQAALHLHETDHIETCGCWQCNGSRNVLGIVTGGPDHRPYCSCSECEQYREMAKFGPVPPHGMSCQCRDCSQARFANQTARMGHRLGCPCPTCNYRRNQPHTGLGFGHSKQTSTGFDSSHLTAFPTYNCSRLPGT